MGNKLKMYVDVMACHPGVTGSCIPCILKLPNRETTKFVVDCGLFQGEDEYLKYNDCFPFDCSDVSFVLLTHNHVDHNGRLPMLVKNGFEGKIYTSNGTKTLLPFSLFDSQRVLADIYKRQYKKSLYSEADVNKTLAQTVGMEYNKKYEITPNIAVTFLQNAHIVGASMIFVEITYQGEEPINILFTGDYGYKNDFFDVLPIPQEIKRKRLSIITESTYGTTSIKDINYGYFKEKIVDAIEKEKTVVVPVLSLGRSQQILYELTKLQDLGKLDKDVPIFFDGKLAHCYTRIYLDDNGLIKESMKEFLPENITFVNSELRQELLNTTNKKIIVTTSGMGSYGPAQVYLPYFISQRNALILFTCYTAVGTVGANLKNANIGDVVKVNGLLKRKIAEVLYCQEFSSHAKQEELLSFLKSFTNLRGVLINHGEAKVKEYFAEKVYNEVDASDIAILNRDYFFRLGSYGIEKTLTTKFN